jgi:hypothetical protein
MRLSVPILIRNLATGLKNAADHGQPYENISIFSPQITPTDLGSYGPASLTKKDDDSQSKWKGDMRRQGPYPPERDVFEKDYTPMDTVHDEIPAGVGFDVEGPKTDAQGKRTQNIPDDPEPGMISPIDLNREIFSPAAPDDMGSAL